ncbi:hypothetical protein AAEX37_01031 [Oligella sp. MSHR50489EDL]
MPSNGAFKFNKDVVFKSSLTSLEPSFFFSTLDKGERFDSYEFDASRVARTSTETRSANTALAPRIIAF